MFDLPANYQSTLITVVVFIITTALALGVLLIGVPRWAGIQCNAKPIGGPTLCGLAMALMAAGTVRIHVGVAAIFCVLLAGCAVAVQRAIVKQRAEHEVAKPRPRERNRIRPPAPPVHTSREKAKK